MWSHGTFWDHGWDGGLCASSLPRLFYFQKTHETGLGSPWGAGASFSLMRCYHGGRGEVRVTGEVGRERVCGRDRPHMSQHLVLTAAVHALTHTEEPPWPGMGVGGMVLSKHKGLLACSRFSLPAHRLLAGAMTWDVFLWRWWEH